MKESSLAATALELSRRWWWILLTLPALSGIAIYALSSTLTPMYEARASLFIDTTQPTTGSNYNDLLAAERLSSTYSRLATTNVVLSETAARLDESLGADDLDAMVQVSAIANTQLLEVTVTDSDRQRAPRIANTLAAVFTERALAISSPDSSVRVRIVDPAVPPEWPISPRTTLNTVLGGMLGALLAVGVIAILGYRDNTVKTNADVERITGRSTIGLIPQFQPSVQLEAIANPMSPATESYRGLRTNLQFATMGQEIKSLAITSSGPGEGKSTTVMNLGVVLAQSGQRVILIDADLRRPTLHMLGGINNRTGLTRMLITRAGSDVSSYPQETGVESLRVVPTGPLPPNPADVLSSKRMQEIVSQLGELADIILIDTPPLIFSDAQIVATHVDGCLVITKSGKTRATELSESALTLKQSGVNLVGVVINYVNFSRAEGRRRKYYTTHNRPRLETQNLVTDGRSRPPARERRKFRGNRT